MHPICHTKFAGGDLNISWDGILPSVGSSYHMCAMIIIRIFPKTCRPQQILYLILIFCMRRVGLIRIIHIPGASRFMLEYVCEVYVSPIPTFFQQDVKRKIMKNVSKLWVTPGVWLKLNFASCVTRQTHSSGALVLCSF